jgi:MFS family permease
MRGVNQEKKDRILAAALSLVVVLAFGVLPYMLAARAAAPFGEFGGFLINPIDGFSYLAKMRQGVQGSWLLQLPYAAEPGQGAFIYVYHLFLGHVARWLGASLLTVYHAARALAALGMFLVAFLLLQRLLPDRRIHWTAFLLTLLGSGLGWLAQPLGVLSIDLWVSEAIPFLSAYANAHFPLAAASFVGVVLVTLRTDLKWVWRVALSMLCGFVLGAVFPFGVGTLLAVLGAWLLWELIRSHDKKAWLLEQRERLIGIAALLVAALPWLLYDLLISRSHEVLAIWTAQNQTPSPPLMNTLLGFGLVFLLALVAIFLGRAYRSQKGRLLISCVAVNFLLLYVPFSLQRRLSLGLFFPLAALAAMGIVTLASKPRRQTLLLVLTLVLSIPTNLFVVSAGLWGAAQGEPALVILSDEAAAFAWLEANAPPDSLVLAAEENGNRLPAFADVRVRYGHPFETPQAGVELAAVEALYAWQEGDPDALNQLRASGVDYVFFGPRERALGDPAWLETLEIVFQEGEVAIYRVASP